MSGDGRCSVWRGFAGDFTVFRDTYHRGRPWHVAVAAFVAQPSTPALRLFRMATSGNKLVSLLARRRLIRRFACDVEQGATFAAGLLIAHPVGIVIGGDTVLGPRVKLHHNVTMGVHRDGCPTVEESAYIFAGAVVVGPITVGEGATIGANAFVSRDVAAGAVVPGGTRWVGMPPAPSMAT